MVWKEVKIGDIAKINPETIKKSDNFTFIEYLDTSSVTENNFDNPLSISIDEAPSRAKRRVRDNDIIISTVRPNLKHYGFIKKANENLIVSTGFAVVRCNQEIVDSQYIYYFIS